jgi:pimeloyl-ACP methyl ester carboxylesterase
MTRAPLINWGDGFAARVVSGGPDAVLWIHGYTLDSSSWLPVWDLLPGWTHIGVDLPGHGSSLPLKDGESLPSLARRLWTLAARHDVRHCVALSFGTLVATQMAIERPDALATLVLAAPALGGGPQENGVGVRYQELITTYRQRGFGPHLRARWMTSPPDIFKGAEARPELWARLWRLVGRHPWWELADDSFARFANHPQTQSELRRIGAPTLVLIGDNELAAFKRCAELIRRAIPAVHRTYLPEAGHLCMLEQPELSAPLIGNHLRHGHARSCADPVHA